jgi:hypothetical protein
MFICRFPNQHFIFFLCIFISVHTHSQQTKNEVWKSLSSAEKKWAFFHPFIANKAYSCAKLAREETNTLKKDTVLDKDTDGGQLDAFRHAYWMALLSQKLKTKKALKLGEAHEKGNYMKFLSGQLEDSSLPDSVAGEMDNWNNIKGLEIGKQNPESNQNELKAKVIEAILRGNMKIVLKNKNGQPLSCSHEVIDVLKYKGVWNIPKCLVYSNYKPD